MIMVDTNILLRYLTPATDPETAQQQRQATALFEAIELGDVTATISEVALHEACYVLGSGRHYGIEARDVIRVLRLLLQYPGWWFRTGDLPVYLRALDLWEEHPRLEFSDAVIAARCEHDDLELASFDRHFDRLHHLRRWTPSATSI